MVRMLLTGGGTGGHVYPLIAVARELRKTAVEKNIDLELRYFGPADIFNFYVSGEGIRVQTITGSKLRRYASWLNILDVPRFFWGLVQSLWKVFWYMPAVTFSKGGTGALPVLWACRFYRIPVVIHESDSVPGLTNQLSARFAKIIEIAWPEAAEYFPKRPNLPIHVVGNPVRDEVLQLINRAEARRSFGLDPEKPTLFVNGSSQGSVRMNTFIAQNLEALLAECQIIHQTGTANYQEYASQFERLPAGYFIAAYFDKNLANAYAAADAIAGRGSSGTIFESAAWGVPAILIPLPEAAQDHQRRNAYAYAHTGAGIVIEETNLLPSLFLGELKKILLPDRRQAISAAAKAFYQPGAAAKIAQDIFVILSGGQH